MKKLDCATINRVAKDFNDFFIGKLLIYFPESPTYQEGKSDMLKDFITNPRVTIEVKGGKTFKS